MKAVILVKNRLRPSQIADLLAEFKPWRSKYFDEWCRNRKVVIIKSADLFADFRKARDLGVESFMLYGDKRFAFEKLTPVACVIGPAPESEVDQITGNMKLL